VNHDALMRWEWEGGASAAASKRNASADVESAETARIRKQTTSRRQEARRAAPAAVSRTPSDGRRGDDGDG